MRAFVPVLAVLMSLAPIHAVSAEEAPRPNFIIIFTDDQGYGDLGCYGSPDIQTPNIDRMAQEGLRFTSFYAAPFCGPSRAALLTGCYAPRLSLSFNHGPDARTGIHPDEITLPEILRTQGYATMHIGKWHLGDHRRFLPTRHGFDRFLGLPYSNDMWPYHPKMPVTENEHPRMVAARERAAMTGFAGEGIYYPQGGGFPQPLPLIADEEVLETNPDQTKLTTLYTEKALEFITENRARRFFLYLAHAMPHVPLFVSDKFKGKSVRGLYGDVISEIDWSVGQIIGKLKELGIDEKTLIFYTSDNGPWLPYGIDGGSAGPLRAGKGSVYEGGVRVPGIARWPGRIPGGRRTSEIAATIDLLPTFARLAGTVPPTDRVIDGRDLWPLLSGRPGARSPHDAFYYYGGSRPGQANLRAVRSGRWKLFLDGRDEELRGTELYDLHRDVSEVKDRAAEQPEVVARLQEMARQFAGELRRNTRPLGRLPDEPAENGEKTEKIDEVRKVQREIRKMTFVYKEVDGLKIRLDVHRPDDQELRPVAIWIHGGALIMGSRVGINSRVKTTLLDAGYAVVSIDYRLAPETKLPEIVRDVEDAYRWVHRFGSELFRGDTRRIVVLGGSAGGYLTLTLGFRGQPRPAALVAFWGYGDLIGPWYSEPSEFYRGRPLVSKEDAFRAVAGSPLADGRRGSRQRGAFYLYCRQNGLWPELVSGHDPRKEPGAFTPYMPARNVTGDYPPTLLIHGTRDTDVPYEQSVIMRKALERHGIDHRLVTVQDAGHGLAGGDPERLAKAYAEVLPFIERVVKGR